MNAMWDWMQSAMWGPPGGKGGFGPAAGGWGGGGGSGPYGKGGGAAPSAPVQEYKPPKAPEEMPDIIWLQVSPDSKLAQQGYATEGCAIEHEKLDVFSESHYWCQEFFDNYLKEECEFEDDWEGKKFPEIKQAWRAAGKQDNWPIVATCKRYQVWAVGFGGKKNGERALKLAMATVLARKNPPTLGHVLKNYPSFGTYLQKIGLLEV